MLAAKYVVAADGAASKIREHVAPGGRLDGRGALASLMNVHFRSAHLAASLRDRMAMLYFIYNPTSVAVLVAHDLARGDYVVQIPYFPPAQTADDFANPALIERLVRAVVGEAAELQDLEICEVRPWTMAAGVSPKWVSNQGRVILAGDAAHVFPPAGGFGMNAGVGDAHMLASCLARALQADGGTAIELLREYESERGRSAREAADLAVTNYEETLDVASAIGLPRVAADLASSVAASLPFGTGRAVMDAAVSIGLAQTGWLAEDGNPIGRARLRAMRNIFMSGKSLRLHYPDVR